MADVPTTPPTEGAPEGAGTVGSMSPQDLAALIANAVAEAIQDLAEPAPEEGDEGERQQFEADEEMIPGDEPEDDRTHYEADDVSQAGGSNAAVPGAMVDEKARKMYGRVAKAQAENDEVVAYLFDRLTAMEHDKRRINYERTLDSLVSDGYQIDAEARAELLADLKPDTPADYEARKEKEIRRFYARMPVGNHRVPVAGFQPPAPAGANSAPSADERRRATTYAMKNGCSFGDALKAVREAV